MAIYWTVQYGASRKILVNTRYSALIGYAVPDPVPQVPDAGSSITITGSLPPGLAVSHGWWPDDKNYYTLSGTPTATGVYSFSGYVTCLPDGTTATIGTYTISVCTGHLNRKAAGRLARNARKHLVIGGSGSPSTPPVNITTVALPNVVYGAPYNIQMAASGGTAPYTWSVPSGSFPFGISMSSAGLISGSSTAAAGDYSVTIRCADASSQSTTKQFNFSMLAQVANVLFSLESNDYYGAYNSLQVYDPAGYAYSANSQNQEARSDWWPYPGQSMPQNHIFWDPIGDVSPNGGRVRWNVAPAGIAIHWSPSSPSGVYKFWVERTEDSSMSRVNFRYRIYVNSALFWERTEPGVSTYSANRRYTQLWAYNTATGIVS